MGILNYVIDVLHWEKERKRALTQGYKMVCGGDAWRTFRKDIPKPKIIHCANPETSLWVHGAIITPQPHVLLPIPPVRLVHVFPGTLPVPFSLSSSARSSSPNKEDKISIPPDPLRPRYSHIAASEVLSIQERVEGCFHLLVLLDVVCFEHYSP